MVFLPLSIGREQIKKRVADRSPKPPIKFNPSAETDALYLTGAGRKGGDWRDVQNLQLIHVPVEDDGGSVHISGPGGRVRLREIVIDELADYRSFPHSGSTDDCDTQRLHHSWSTSSAPWTATTNRRQM